MGVCVLDIAKDSWLYTFGVNCLNYGTPVRVLREFNGDLYVGTNNGLECYNMKTGHKANRVCVAGLTDNGISGIEPDKQGNLWISTDHGLFRMNPKTSKTDDYYADNGLQGNEFSDGASWVMSGGRMVFGGLAYSEHDGRFYNTMGKQVRLTPMQLQLMEMFFRSESHQLTKTEICDALWPKKD